MAYVTDYQKCKCGAVTLFFDNGADTSMYQETFDKMNIDLSEANEMPQSYCCNHCVNRWGIDLCECGSGERVGECECGSHKPMQQFGEKFDSFRRVLENFSRVAYG